MNIYKFNHFIKENKNKKIKLTPEEQKIVDDILSVNENFSNVLNKIKKYAKMGVLTLGILLSVSLNVKGENDIKDIIETGIEYSNKEIQKDIYRSLAGLTSIFFSKALEEGNLERAKILKLINNYYLLKYFNRDVELPDKYKKFEKEIFNNLKKYLNENNFDMINYLKNYKVIEREPNGLYDGITGKM